MSYPMEVFSKNKNAEDLKKDINLKKKGQNVKKKKPGSIHK